LSIRQIDIGAPDRFARCKVAVAAVSKRFGAGTRSVLALDSVDVALCENDFLCVVGPSGCGKSTLLNLIAGFEQPSEGTVTLAGKPIRRPGAERGVVFQQGALFSWMTVRDNIAFGPECRGVPRAEARAIADRYIEVVGLTGFGDRYTYELSGGMQQRVGIARVLANDCDVLLMDEPFAALDAQTREILQEEIKNLWRASRKTILWITHSIEEALFLGTHVVVMTARPGRIKASFECSFGAASDFMVTTTAEFAEAKREITHLLRNESRLAREQEERLSAGAAHA
jgi:ABC-type nitrate/sulfonate/bicarbonate transport system ATPase subunit